MKYISHIRTFKQLFNVNYIGLLHKFMHCDPIRGQIFSFFPNTYILRIVRYFFIRLLDVNSSLELKFNPAKQRADTLFEQDIY